MIEITYVNPKDGTFSTTKVHSLRVLKQYQKVATIVEVKYISK